MNGRKGYYCASDSIGYGGSIGGRSQQLSEEDEKNVLVSEREEKKIFFIL